MQVLVHDDVRIATRVDGSHDDTIVLIHGYPFAKEIWSAQIPELAKTHRTVALDLRGMGESSVVDGPYLMETLAGDVAALMDQLQVERATIVGHSLGGYVALAFARMYLERVARLALVCSRIDADPPQRIAERNRIADEMEATNSIALAEGSIASLVSQKTRDERAKTLENIGKVVRSNSARGLAAMQRGMALRDAADDIAPELVVPVLVVAGDDDPAVSPAEFEATARAFPKASVRVLEGSGHLPMAEDPEAFTRVLTDFIRL